jgi:ERCC4-type nuclease
MDGLSEYQGSLLRFVEMSSVRIVVDPDELHSGVVKALEKQDIEIKITKLEAGNYEANNRIAFERMTIYDFLKSIFEDRKLLSRIKDLANSYERPILIIEGDDPFFSDRTINPTSIQSFLKTIAVSFRVPTLYTLNEAETAEIISSIARAEQADEI